MQLLQPAPVLLTPLSVECASITAGGILTAVVCIAGIVFALLYFQVSSIHTLFCNSMSYNIIRESLAM